MEYTLFVALGVALIALGSLFDGCLFELFQLSIFETGVVAAVVAASGILYALYTPSVD